MLADWLEKLHTCQAGTQYVKTEAAETLKICDVLLKWDAGGEDLKMLSSDKRASSDYMLLKCRNT